MKKIICALSALIISVVTMCTPFAVQASEQGGEIEIRNPFLCSSSQVNLEKLMSSSSSAKTKSSSSSIDGESYYTLGTSIYIPVRNLLANHKSSIDIKYLSSSYMSDSAVSDLVTKIFVNSTSDELSVSSVDGDYARWSVSSYTMLPDYRRQNGKYYYDIEVDFEYTTTDSEEKQTDSAVQKIVSSINTSSLTDYQILKKIHDYICEKTEYDYTAVRFSDSIFASSYYYAFSAYGALIKGASVCQGYALAFYRICRELGFDCRLASSDPEEGCHGWNLVSLDGKYYYVDCTWDDEDSEYTHDYFLVDYDTLRSDDSSSREHTLDPEYFDNDYFDSNYGKYIATSDYNASDNNLLSSCTVDLSTKTYAYSGTTKTPAVTVKKNGTTVSSSNYSVIYSSNTNSGRATVKIIGKNKYSDSSVKRVFFITPSKASTPKVASGGRKSSSLSLKWNASGGSVSGYVVEKYTSSGWKSVKVTSSTSCKISSLSPSTTYKFRIRAYKTVNRKNYYGAYSTALTTVTIPKKASLSSVSAGKKSAKLKWKKVTCSGYQIQYSTSKSFKNAKTVKVKSSATSKKISKLKKGKKYYFRIRSYKTLKTGSKTHKYYSSWSSKKSAKIK